MTESDLQLYKHMLETAKKAARQAGEYQKERWHTDVNVEYKGEINLVTEVDQACEKMIVETISKEFPDHDILAEEGHGHRKDSIYKWIIDPLDGTTNFAHAYPLFCVSIALECQGKILLGVVYEPLLDEMFIAIKGQGAFLNDKPIKVSPAKNLAESLMATGFAYNLRETNNNNMNHFNKMLMHAQGLRRDGVAAIDLCYVACGRYDGYWELNLYPWDMAAGMLILEESGGRVSVFNGSPFTVYDKEILATNGHIHDEAIKVLS